MKNLTRFWEYPGSSRQVFTIKLAFVFTALVHLHSTLPLELSAYYSKTGFYPSLQPNLWNWNGLDWVPKSGWFLLKPIVSILLLVSLIPFFSRFTLVLTWLWHLSIYRHSLYLSWHLDALLCITNFYLIFLPNLSSQKHATPPLRLLQIQLSLVYLGSVLSKLHGGMWVPFDPLEAFTQSWFIGFSPKLELPPWILATALPIQLILAIGIWFRRFHTITFCTAVLFHGSLMVFTNIQLFSFFMICLHFSYICPSRETLRVRRIIGIISKETKPLQEGPPI